MREKRDWEGRFIDMLKFVKAECALVFIDEGAARAKEIRWPESHRHRETQRVSEAGLQLGPTEKIYLFGESRDCKAVFDLAAIDGQLRSLGLKEDFLEWTFLRWNARIVCMRAHEPVADRVSQGTEETQTPLWGFGRPHHFKDEFRPHKDLAGPLVDYRPGRKDGWQFEPVFMKILPSTIGTPGQYNECSPAWEEYSVTMKALICLPSQVPPALAGYEFRNARPFSSPPPAEHSAEREERFEEVFREIRPRR